jgi:hypothetical protein
MVIANNIPLDIREIIRTRARNIYAYRINFQEVGYETLPKMKAWCESNCEGLWDSHSTYALYFRFAEERDATMFMLRWGGADGNKLK